MKSSALGILIAVVLTSSAIAGAAEVRQVSDITPSYICIVADTGLPVFERNADDGRAPASMVKMMQMLLVSYGYEVVTANDGLSALTALEVEQPDVAFIDIGLPELDGHEVARRVRKRLGHASAFLVALTGYGQAADRQKALDAGFDDHLTKPVDMGAVWKVLETASRARASGRPC